MADLLLIFNSVQVEEHLLIALVRIGGFSTFLSFDIELYAVACLIRILLPNT